MEREDFTFGKVMVSNVNGAGAERKTGLKRDIAGWLLFIDDRQNEPWWQSGPRLSQEGSKLGRDLLL